jgi:UDP-GlcNAc:undecaprenyl-phosphate/decaprenyl-phosphate GlcNAc-1-phosphate transferase
MGDTGSLFVGTVLAALALRPHLPGEQADPVLIMAVALAFPIADTALAMIRRTACGVPMFLGDREHVHHRLIDRGLSQPRAVAVLWAASIVLAGCGVWMASHGDSAFLLALAVVAAGVLALGKLGCIPWPTAAVRQRRRVNRARLRAVRSVERQLKRARSVAAVAEHLAAAAPGLGADAVRLCAGPPPPAADRARPASVPVDALRPELGSLEVVWTDPTWRLDRDTELALEILCRSVAVALDRVERDALAEALWRWRLERAVRPARVRRARSGGAGDGVGRRA